MATEDLANELSKKFEFTKETLTSISDAIFAIAITLLVIDIKLPEGLAEGGGQYLLSALVDLWPNFLSYVVSFVLIAVYWYNYHKFIYYAVEVDNKTVCLNIVFLFFVTIMPFTASMLGVYGDESVAVVLYATSIAAGSTVLFMLWRHIMRKHLQAENAFNKRYLYYLSMRALFPVIIALLAMVLALFSPFVAKIFLLLDPISIWISPVVSYWILSRFSSAKYSDLRNEQQTSFK
jgi:uncharacterized membrane protein